MFHFAAVALTPSNHDVKIAGQTGETRRAILVGEVSSVSSTLSHALHTAVQCVPGFLILRRHWTYGCVSEPMSFGFFLQAVSTMHPIGHLTHTSFQKHCLLLF